MTNHDHHIRNRIGSMWHEFVDPTRDVPLGQSVRDHYEDRQHGVIVDYERTGRHAS